MKKTIKSFLMILLGLLIILVLYQRQVQTVGVTDGNKIILTWLSERDPDIFNRCKVFLDADDTDYSIHKEGNFTLVSARLCGNITTFWINNRSHSIDCYMSYCGKNISKKYCGNEIAERACNQ